MIVGKNAGFVNINKMLCPISRSYTFVYVYIVYIDGMVCAEWRLKSHTHKSRTVSKAAAPKVAEMETRSFIFNSLLTA